MKQLKFFLGSINHQAKFIPNAANFTDKLRPLLREENQNKKLKKREIGTEKLRTKNNIRVRNYKERSSFYLKSTLVR